MKYLRVIMGTGRQKRQLTSGIQPQCHKITFPACGAAATIALAFVVIITAGCSDRLEIAHALLEAGDYLGARDIYTQEVERRPGDYAAQYGLGMTWCAEAIYKSELGLAEPDDWYPAIYHVSRALNLGGGEELRKTLAILHFNLGAHYRKISDNMAAIERIEQALAYDSTLLKALNLLGTIYHQSGDLDKAQACYSRTVAIKPDYALAHFNLGAVSWAKGEYANAVTHFEHALSVEPSNGYFGSWLEKARQRVVQ